LKPDHACDAISVVAEFMVGVAEVEARVRDQIHASRLSAFLPVSPYIMLLHRWRHTRVVCFLTCATTPHVATLQVSASLP
jgi:hypothetical protein